MNQFRFDTAAIHAGYRPDEFYGAINIPIYASSTFAQDGLAELRRGFEYTRVGNPTIRALEDTVAALEHGTYARAFSSGMAAIDTVLRALLRPGDHVILPNDAYGGTYRLLVQVYQQWGIELSIVDITDLDAVKAAVKPNTKIIWAETPTNPMLNIADVPALAKIAASGEEIRLVVDNTFASPFLQQPLTLGADVVIHSTTKYLGGHSDVVGGVIITNDEACDEQFAFLQGWVGAIPSVFDCYLTIRGIKTLPVRMRKHCDNAKAIAEFLESQPVVKQVLYPGLPSHPGHEIAAKQMPHGAGGMISVRFQTEAQARKFCLSTKLISLAESLGGVESLVEHPATMTHLAAADSECAVPADLVRISIGIEDLQDLLDDLSVALAALEDLDD